MWTVDARRRYAWTRRKEGLRLADQEWAILKPLLPHQASMGRPWKHTRRTLLDAILHILRTGCPWSALPDWAPPRSTVYELVPMPGGRRLVGAASPCTADGSPANTKGATRARRSALLIARQSAHQHSGHVGDLAEHVRMTLARPCQRLE